MLVEMNVKLFVQNGHGYFVLGRMNSGVFHFKFVFGSIDCVFLQDDGEGLRCVGYLHGLTFEDKIFAKHAVPTENVSGILFVYIDHVWRNGGFQILIYFAAKWEKRLALFRFGFFWKIDSVFSFFWMYIYLYIVYNSIYIYIYIHIEKYMYIYI